MPYADNNGVRIHYQVEGDGPPLVLQHGFTSSLRRWYLYGYVDALKADYQLILVNARGHGQSDKPHEPDAYDVSLMAGDVVAVLDALHLDKAHFWGYSMGGWIGYGMAKYALERVQTFILGGMHPYGRKLPLGTQLDGSDPEAFVNALMGRLSVDLSAMPPEIREELFANDFQALAAAQQDFPSIAEIIPTMTMPCLLYAGEHDATYYAKTRECAQHLPNATFFPLPELDHAAGFRESGLVLPHATKFLRENS
jgi:pimeloyl-ACP methyl ester carboxylesterase